MYKVLIVDDERIIREGIAEVINWEENDCELIGTAKDGLQAYDMIKKHSPDIVFTDIKMPGISGLELIEKVTTELSDIAFIILSGYGEFEYAKTAMKYGVKHYLLKPTDEEEIVKVLKQVIAVLQLKKQNESFTKRIKNDLEKMAPLVKEQFLRDYIMNRNYAGDEFDYYCKYFGIENQDKDIRVVLFQLQNENDIEELFSLRDITEHIIDKDILYLSTTIKNQVMVIVYAVEDEVLIDLLKKIKSFFEQFYNTDMIIAYSEVGTLKETPYLYRETQKCFKYSFYLYGESIITKSDIVPDKSQDPDRPVFDFNAIGETIKSGDKKAVNRELTSFFEKLEKAKFPINVVTTYCLELYMTIVRQANQDEMDDYIRDIVTLQQCSTFVQLESFIRNAAEKITKSNYENIKKCHSKLIETAIKYIDENLDNEQMSLRWLANNILFTNVDYLGKLFKKETEENFSHYVMKKRMEKAKEYLTYGTEEKIYEIAEKVGFGNNSQYFSQVFKKYTGYSPLEYKEIAASKNT